MCYRVGSWAQLEDGSQRWLWVPTPYPELELESGLKLLELCQSKNYGLRAELGVESLRVGVVIFGVEAESLGVNF